jgi:molecular chaperone GrpE
MTGRERERPDSDQERPARVRVSDRRRSSETRRGDAASDAAPVEPAEPGPWGAEIDSLRAQVGELTDNLQRLGAEFDNYRKRMMRDQAQIGDQATAAMVKKLLPLLDNFDRAIAHGADDNVGLLRKELMKVLTAEGVEEIPALGAHFDPHVHEAVESREDPEVAEPTVTTVFRTGYRLGPKVLRPAMVAVARPAESQPDESPDKPSDHADIAAGDK